MRSAIGRAFLQIAICATAPHACAPAVGAMTLAAGGSATDALKATAFAFASQMVWTEVGFHVRDAGIASNIVAKSAVHGVVGGALSMAQGGTFVDGFVANGVGAAAGIAGLSFRMTG